MLDPSDFRIIVDFSRAVLGFHGPCDNASIKFHAVSILHRLFIELAGHRKVPWQSSLPAKSSAISLSASMQLTGGVAGRR